MIPLLLIPEIEDLNVDVVFAQLLVAAAISKVYTQPRDEFRYTDHAVFTAPCCYCRWNSWTHQLSSCMGADGNQEDLDALGDYILCMKITRKADCAE